MTDAELARALAVDVGDLLRRIRDEGVEDGAALGKRGDREANALILARLAIERPDDAVLRSEEHTSELQSLMRISYAVFCLKKKNLNTNTTNHTTHNTIYNI